MQKATLITNVLAGIARNDRGEHIPVFPYIGKTGIVLEVEDTGYDTDEPTGYEPVIYLVDFGDQKLWIPSSIYNGYDKQKEKDIFTQILKIEQVPYQKCDTPTCTKKAIKCLLTSTFIYESEMWCAVRSDFCEECAARFKQRHGSVEAEGYLRE